MTVLYTLVAVYLLLGAAIEVFVAIKRRGSPVTGPFLTPDNVRFYVVWHDALSDLVMKGHANAVTIGNHIGLSTTASLGIWRDWSILHEREHVQQQCWPLGSHAPAFLLAITRCVTGPVVILLSVLGPFEEGPATDGMAMQALPVTDPTRIPWTMLATQVEATHPK